MTALGHHPFLSNPQGWPLLTIPLYVFLHPPMEYSPRGNTPYSPFGIFLITYSFIPRNGLSLPDTACAYNIFAFLPRLTLPHPFISERVSVRVSQSVRVRVSVMETLLPSCLLSSPSIADDVVVSPQTK